MSEREIRFCYDWKNHEPHDHTVHTRVPGSNGMGRREYRCMGRDLTVDPMTEEERARWIDTADKIIMGSTENIIVSSN